MSEALKLSRFSRYPTV
uniref:Uncharacterized protein n=1 Tax=Anguilla anguilla TaxID=7936 RepID=A0A0E9PZH2_ANGAN